MEITKIHLIAAARPNFMKIAPLYHALAKEHWADAVIVHTGQHYDQNMSQSFFDDLGMPSPHIYLGVGSGTHAEQTGKVMIAYEKVLVEERPDLVIVVGDVNSTMACALAAVKLGVKTAHLEAGLRSFDRSMPEEINRLVTDAVCDILWTPSEDGDRNLLREGVAAEKIERVGNIMIDSLEMLRDKIEREKVCDEIGVVPGAFGLVTLHRPANVDPPEKLKNIRDRLLEISTRLPLVFPVHPRTRKNLSSFGLLESLQSVPGIRLTDPLPYIRFMNLVFKSRLLLTDSGGVQEETSYLGIPCLTLRPNTERPVTIAKGTNRLCRIEELSAKVDSILDSPPATKPEIELWDGRTADRILESIRAMAL